MFNLFSKKSSLRITDTVWMTKETKWKGIAAYRQQNQAAIICWFEDTWQQLQSLFGNDTADDGSLFLASHLHPSQLAGKAVIFAEHYPLREKETDLFERLKLTEAVIHSSLDEPLFLHFGGERLAGLMKQMGMEAGESVRHPMISKAIANAQDKIRKKAITESLATSAAQWFEKNISQ